MKMKTLDRAQPTSSRRRLIRLSTHRAFGFRPSHIVPLAWVFAYFAYSAVSLSHPVLRSFVSIRVSLPAIGPVSEPEDAGRINWHLTKSE